MNGLTNFCINIDNELFKFIFIQRNYTTSIGIELKTHYLIVSMSPLCLKRNNYLNILKMFVIIIVIFTKIFLIKMSRLHC